MDPRPSDSKRINANVKAPPAPGTPAAALGAPPPRTNRTRRVPHPVLTGHAASLSQVTKVAVAPDQRSIVSVGDEGAVLIWNIPERFQQPPQEDA